MLDGIWSFCRSFGLIDVLSDDIFLFYFAPGFSMQWSVYAIIVFSLPFSNSHLQNATFLWVVFWLIHPNVTQSVNIIGKCASNGEAKRDKTQWWSGSLSGDFHPTHADDCTEKCFIVEISSKQSEPNIRASQNLEKFWLAHKRMFQIFLHLCCHAASFIQKIATHFFLS